MSNVQNNSEEEIDLGSLFIIIGKGLKKTASSIFNTVLCLLFFFKKNILFLVIPAFIGALYGYYLEKKTGQKFESSLYVKPNFESTIQFYESVKGYNNLIGANDISTLEKVFSISEEEAKSLKSFKVEPVIETKDVIASFKKELDTIRFIDEKNTFSNFQKGFKREGYKVHKVSVITTQNNVFKKLTQSILSSINKNHFLSQRKIISNKGMTDKKLFLERKLTEIDSVLTTNYKLLKTEQNSKIDINYLMGDLNENISLNNDIIQLINNNITVKNKLIETNSYIYEKSNMINLISDFQEVGTKVKIFKSGNKPQKYALLLFLISFSIIMLLTVNAFLTNYKN